MSHKKKSIPAQHEETPSRKEPIEQAPSSDHSAIFGEAQSKAEPSRQNHADSTPGASTRPILLRHLHKIVTGIKQVVQGIWHQKDTIRDIIRNKHRFVVIDSQTFKEKISFQLTGINLFVFLGISMILLVLLTTVIIAFTPLREFIPGYTNNRLAEQSYENAMAIDSLNRVMEEREQMLNDIKAIMMGQDPATLHVNDSLADTAASSVKGYTHSKEDSLLRLEVEEADKYSIRTKPSTAQHDYTNLAVAPVSMQLFFAPLKGKIINNFDPKSSHHGVDISGATNDVVKSILAGTVILTQFSVEDGYIIAIQHTGNNISIYKHNSSILKKEGDVVRAGEPIAFLGNAGEMSAGPHLHFELWVAGKPVNPLQYISF